MKISLDNSNQRKASRLTGHVVANLFIVGFFASISFTPGIVLPKSSRSGISLEFCNNKTFTYFWKDPHYCNTVKCI